MFVESIDKLQVSENLYSAIFHAVKEICATNPPWQITFFSCCKSASDFMYTVAELYPQFLYSKQID